MKEIKYQKKEDVQPIGQVDVAITFKPKIAPIICLIVGILLLLINNIGFRILGGFFILMAVLVLVIVKDYKVVDIYSGGVLLYGDMKGEQCCFITYDEIKIWDVKHDRGQDKIIFELEDGPYIERTSFQADKARKALMRYAREKELRYIKAQISNSKSLNIKETFNVIKERIFKK